LGWLFARHPVCGLLVAMAEEAEAEAELPE
jgi:hypothetical protein